MEKENVRVAFYLFIYICFTLCHFLVVLEVIQSPFPGPALYLGSHCPSLLLAPFILLSCSFFSDVRQLLKWCFGMKGILLRLLPYCLDLPYYLDLLLHSFS